jgi:hypothetical protein
MLCIDVGLPHCRKRWFAVYHEGETFNELIVPESVHRTNRTLVAKPGATTKGTDAGTPLYRLAARLAFFRLYTGFQIQSVSCSRSDLLILCRPGRYMSTERTMGL